MGCWLMVTFLAWDELVVLVADVRGNGESLNFTISTPNELAPPHTTINHALNGKGGDGMIP